MNIEKRIYTDEINDCDVEFYSDATQDLINTLSFNGEWYVVRGILLDWNYKVLNFYGN